MEVPTVDASCELVSETVNGRVVMSVPELDIRVVGNAGEPYEDVRKRALVLVVERLSNLYLERMKCETR